MKFAVLLFAVTGLGCAGTFESARSAGFKEKTSLEAPPRGPEEKTNCDTLDNQRMLHGFLAKVFGGAAGTSGFSSLAVNNDDIKSGLVVGAAVSGILAVGFVYLSENYATRWVRECQ